MRRKTALVIIAVIAVSGLLTLYGTVEPSSGYYPRCLFKAMTGWDCPGCGSQRALHALLQGDFALAWQCNAMLFILCPLILLMFAGALFKLRHPRLHALLNTRTSSLILLSILVIWTIYRNITI